MMRADVVALYVDPKGPYPLLVADWYDEARDAKTYDRTLPVVAHPPCGPWASLRHLSQQQDKTGGPHAVEVVRKYGGVLEHPRGSKLFDHCGLPKPGDPPDAWGGYTIEVAQCDWGHVARKRTWLYLVGVTELGPMPPTREPTHWASGRRGKDWTGGGRVPPGIKVCSAQQRRRTPVAFAEWLLSLAAHSRRPW